MEILKTNALTKTYGGIPVVNDVNMNINKGDIYGFIGENGSGKTTLIRMICGLIKTDGGHFSLFGVNNNDASFNNVKRKLGAIVESPSIHPNLTAIENLIIQGKLIGVTDQTQMVSLLNDVGLDYLVGSKKKAKSFSLGMKQRLGIAMTLLSDPEFLILDEPMNGLDPEGIVGIRNLISRLNKEKGITFLISSHILSELAKVATKYGFIHRGKLIQEIEASELLDSSKSVTDVFVSSNKDIDKLLSADMQYELISNNQVRFLGEVNISEIITLFTQNNITITDIKKESENIENYYFKIVEENRQ